MVGVTLLTCLSSIAELYAEPLPLTIGERWLGLAGITGLAVIRGSDTAGLEIDFDPILDCGERFRMSRFGLEVEVLPGE